MPNAQLDVRLVDLSSLTSIRSFAGEFLADYDRLDVLMNNAGLVSSKQVTTEDGFEQTLQVNHLGHFLLTALLKGLLLASAPSRVVHVASVMHRFSDGNLEDLNWAKGWGSVRTYNLSKLLNVLFSNELANRLQGTGVTSNAAHPGGVASNFGFGAGNAASRLKFITKAVLRSPSNGARTQVRLAADPSLATSTGGYYANSKPKKPSRTARDVDRQRRLWELSEELLGLA